MLQRTRPLWYLCFCCDNVASLICCVALSLDSSLVKRVNEGGITKKGAKCLVVIYPPSVTNKLVMPEREVAVCSADEGQQARNSCPELPIFFLLASHGVLLHVILDANLPEVPSLSASASYQSQEEDNREVSNLGAGDGSASKPTEPVSEQAGDDPGSESANYHSGSGSEDLGEANDDDDKEKEHKPGLLLMMGFIIAGFLFCLVIVGVIYCMAK